MISVMCISVSRRLNLMHLSKDELSLEGQTNNIFIKVMTG